MPSPPHSTTSTTRRAASLVRVPTLRYSARQATIASLFLRQSELDKSLFADAPATPERWRYLRSWRRHLPDGTVLVTLRTGLGIVVLIQVREKEDGAIVSMC